MDFETFLNGFRERFGQDIRSFVDEWYTSREIPRLIIKDIMYRRTEEIQSVDFKVGNTGNVDGVVSLLLVELTTSGKNAIVNSQSFLIRPGNTSVSWHTRNSVPSSCCPPIFQNEYQNA